MVDIIEEIDTVIADRGPSLSLVVIDGQVYQNLTRFDVDGLADTPEIAEASWSVGLELQAKIQGRDKVRGQIKRDVGDTATLLGTTADGAQLSVAVLMALVSAISGNTTYTSFKSTFIGTLTALAGVDPLTGDPVDIADVANGFLGKLQTGEIKLTAVIKGVSTTVDEIGGRATGVADILIATAAAQAGGS